MQIITVLVSCVFIFCALIILQECEDIGAKLYRIEQCEGTIICSSSRICLGNPWWIVPITAFSQVMLHNSKHMAIMLCSCSVLLVIAIMDAGTGYIYDFWAYTGMLLFGIPNVVPPIPKITIAEAVMIFIYIIAIIFSVVFNGMATGDVGIYFSLLLFYMRYSVLAGEMAIGMLLFSQLITGIMVVINHRRRIPLVPGVWLAHLLTIHLFGI